MVFDRDLKDYYCENCESTLEELELSEFYDTHTVKDRVKKQGIKKLGISKETSSRKKKRGSGKSKSDRDIEKEDRKIRDESDKANDKQLPPTEAGTVKGVMFIMLGSIIDLISRLLGGICAILGVVGIFLLILGFFLVYQDRRRISQTHQRNLRIALIILAIWIIVRIALLIYEYMLTQEFFNQINKLDDDEIIPMKVIVEFFDGLIIVTSFFPLIVGSAALIKFLTIKDLIQSNLRIILTSAVILAIISGFVTMYSNIDNSEKFVDNVGDVTKEEMISGDINNSSKLNLNEYLFYSASFLDVTGEAIMILCFYWTYTYQKSKLQNKNY
jgi:hypothetical protein